jgi:hypothetical protein
VIDEQPEGPVTAYRLMEIYAEVRAEGPEVFMPDIFPDMLA